MKVAPIYGSNLWTGHDRLASAEDRIASSADGRHGISSISDGMVQTGHEHRARLVRRANEGPQLGSCRERFRPARRRRVCQLSHR